MSATTSTTRCSRQIDSVIENSVERPSSLFLEGVFGLDGETGETGVTELTGVAGDAGETAFLSFNAIQFHSPHSPYSPQPIAIRVGLPFNHLSLQKEFARD